MGLDPDPALPQVVEHAVVGAGPLHPQRVQPDPDVESLLGAGDERVGDLFAGGVVVEDEHLDVERALGRSDEGEHRLVRGLAAEVDLHPVVAGGGQPALACDQPPDVGASDAGRLEARHRELEAAAQARRDSERQREGPNGPARDKGVGER
ncbi:hypothetical protein D3C86_1402140 [compost metagenome]